MIFCYYYQLSFCGDRLMTDPLGHTTSLVTNSTERTSHYSINKLHLSWKLIIAGMLRSNKIRCSLPPQFSYRDHQIPRSAHHKENEHRLVLVVSGEPQTHFTLG